MALKLDPNPTDPSAEDDDGLEALYQSPAIDEEARSNRPASQPAAPVDPRSKQPPPPSADDFRSSAPYSESGPEYLTPPPARAEDRSSIQGPRPPKDSERSDNQPPAPNIGGMEAGASVGGGQASQRDPNESRFSNAINKSKGLNNLKERGDNLQNNVQNARKALSKGKDFAKTGEQALKAAKNVAQAGKAGAQASGAASGAATAGIGTAATAAEMVGEAALNKLRKMAKGDFSMSNKTKIAIIVPALVLGLGIIGLIYLPKLGAKTIVSTMQLGLNDRVEYTVKTRANLYLADYAQDVLLPNLKQCGTVINTECYAGQEGETARHKTLYASWKKGKIMDRINRRYAFTFKAGASDNYEDIEVYKDGSYLTNYKSYYDSGLAIEHVMGITEAQNVNERWITRHAITSRFGAKWCILLCADSDALANEDLDLLDKMKLKVSSRVISKSAARIATLLSCGPGCTMDVLLSTSLAAAKQALNTADGTFLREIFEELGGVTKFVNFLTTKVIEAVVISGQGIVKAANFLASLPLKAWHTATSVIAGSMGFIQSLVESKEINQFTAEKNLGEYNESGASTVSSVDEVLTGKAPLRQQGAVFRYLRKVPADRMYQTVRGIYPLSPVTCDDGTVLQADTDARTCTDKHIIRDFEPEAVVTNPLFGFFTNAFNSIASKLDFIPILGTVLNTASDFFTNVGKSVGFVNEEVSPPVYTTEPGGTPLEGTVLAGYFMSKEHTLMSRTKDVDGGWVGMAGKVLTPEVQAKLDLAIADDKNQTLKRQSFYARYISPDNPTSLFSTAMLNVATSMPLLIDEPINFHFNPFSFIGNLGMALGFSQKASAAGIVNIGDRSQYMKIPSLGYDTEELATKPKDLTEQRCGEIYEQWEAGLEENEDGLKLPTASDICLGDDTVIKDLTGWTELQNQSALEKYLGSPLDSAGPVPNGEGCESTPEKFTIFKDGKEGQIYACKVHGFTVNVDIAVKFSAMMKLADEQGQKFGGSALRSHQRQHELRAEHGCGGDGSGVHSNTENPDNWVKASACSPPTAKPGNGQHELGLAIDFTFNGGSITSHGNPGFVWLSQHAKDFGFYNLPSEPWHWSTTGN